VSTYLLAFSHAAFFESAEKRFAGQPSAALVIPQTNISHFTALKREE